MTTLPSGLPVVVDRGGGQPLAIQISAQLQAAVTGGALRAGDRLPSSRDLAATLGVSRTVITNAYARLFAEGWLEGRHGSGTYVADVGPPPALAGPEARPAARGSAMTGAGQRPGGAPGRGFAGADAGPDTERAVVSPGRPAISASGGPAPPAGMIDLQPGFSWPDGIDPASWRRAWRRAGAHLPSVWPDPHGLPELRAEIAAYLRRSRGLAVTPAHVLVTQGVSSGLALLADALLSRGDKAGMEEPGYPTGREVLRRAGARVVPCRVDAHGILPEELPGDLKLLYTTPAHQYPLGGRLPVNRRQALVGWARATGAIVVEDDYDSEFRYDVGPLPALHSLDPDHIVYLGTASKVLATAFGAGWLVAPPALVERLAQLRPRLGVRIPEPVQHAVLALLRSGDLERHVRKMRLEYARRRAALVSALTHACAAPPGAAPLEDSATDVAGAAGLAGDASRAGETTAGPTDAGKLRTGAAGAGTVNATGSPARPRFRLLGDTAGMHVVLELPGDYPTARLIEAAAVRGVVVYPLTRYFAGPPTVNGLILGYGTATLPQVRKAASELAALLTSLPQQK
jgi:GntR family transcriptional regulator/MocR family aminotransferase